MKKTIVHIERDTTKAGRTINALLGLLTANRISFIFSFKLTIVKRNYQPENFKRRAKENLFIALVLFPIFLGFTVMLNKCGYLPDPTPTITPKDTTMNKSDLIIDSQEAEDYADSWFTSDNPTNN